MMNNSNSRIFASVDETSALMTNLFQSLCRSDQDDWLRKMGLTRNTEGGLASSASMRGFSNVSEIVAAAKRAPQTVGHGSSRGSKFELGSPRVAAALRLTGEDHTEEDVTARPRIFDVSNEGARGKQGEMQGWFEEVVSKSSNNGGGGSGEPQEQQQQLLPLEKARKEWLEQEHFGQPDPAKQFDRQLARFPEASKRGALTFDEFAAIFAHFETA